MQQVVKTGGRLITHARYSLLLLLLLLLLAESHLTWRLFGDILGQIDRLPLPPG